MRTITAIEPQKKDPRRVNLYLDGTFAFGLAAITAAWLKVGQELTDDRIAAMQAQDEQESVFQKALHFLSYRPRSTHEVRQNLLKRGCPEEMVETVIARLQANRLLDDAAFARLWIENRSTFRPRSAAALRMELRRKGVDEDLIRSTLEENVDEAALAGAAARKQARRYASLEWQPFRQKLGAFLARRGFSYGTIAPVVSEVWNELQTADAGSTALDKDNA